MLQGKFTKHSALMPHSMKSDFPRDKEFIRFSVALKKLVKSLNCIISRSVRYDLVGFSLFIGDLSKHALIPTIFSFT